MKKQIGPSWRLACVMVGILIAGGVHAQTLSDALAEDQLLGLSVAVSGEVSELSVSVGDQVQKGQLLLSLDRSVLDAERHAASARLSQMRFQLQLQEEEYERQQELYDEGSMSTVELQMQELAVLQSKTALALADADLKRAEQHRSLAQIIAPAEAEVVAVPVIGQRVSIDSGLPVLIKLRLK